MSLSVFNPSFLSFVTITSSLMPLFQGQRVCRNFTLTGLNDGPFAGSIEVSE